MVASSKLGSQGEGESISGGLSHVTLQQPRTTFLWCHVAGQARCIQWKRDGRACCRTAREGMCLLYAIVKRG